MDKKEKIFIVLITIIIIVGIFIAFIVSNSQKTPPEVLVQNEDRKVATAVMGGYTWKVFGNNIISDSIDLKEIDYPSDNTVVSKTGGVLTVTTTEKFEVQEINFIETISSEIIEANSKENGVASYFTITVPELEGTYLCLFKLDYSGKGTAEYAVKVVVTDENIYDVKEIIKYNNTKITDINKINEILDDLPYSDELNGVAINSIDKPKTASIRYNNNSIDKEDLLNNTIALFTLVPELDSIIYENNSMEKSIYYTRDEVNNLMGRNIIEYANDSELWLREVIYKDSNLKTNNDITIYTSVISSSLAKLSEEEIGKFVAIDVSENNVSGDIFLDEFEKGELLSKLNIEYENVLIVNGSEFENNDGTLIYVILSEKIDENTYVVNVNLENKDNFSYSYKAVVEKNSVGIEENIENNSGDQE